MSNNSWYPQQGSSRQDHIMSGPDGNAHDGDNNINPEILPEVVDARRLLSVYPFASATPSSHVARHLSNLSISAPIPSFAHHQSYSPDYRSNNSQPPPYTEYSDMLSAPVMPSAGPERQFWEDQRGHAVRLMSDTMMHQPSLPYQPSPQQPMTLPHSFNPQTNWVPSSYQGSAFATSVIQSLPYQHHAPTAMPQQNTSSGYSSTSSGYTPHQVYTPDQSAAFFDDFLDQTTREIEAQSPTPAPPSQRQQFNQPAPSAPSNNMDRFHPHHPPPQMNRQPSYSNQPKAIPPAPQQMNRMTSSSSQPNLYPSASPPQQMNRMPSSSSQPKVFPSAPPRINRMPSSSSQPSVYAPPRPQAKAIPPYNNQPKMFPAAAAAPRMNQQASSSSQPKPKPFPPPSTPKRKTNHSASQPAPSTDSPDPLALDSSTTAYAPLSVSPLKRKPDILMSPSAKRVHSLPSLTTPSKPSGSSPDVFTVPKAPPPRMKLQPYVEIPVRAKSSSSVTAMVTPQKNRISSKMEKSSTRTLTDDDDDLGGFDTPSSDIGYRYKGGQMSTGGDSSYSVSKSSGKRTGDRDDRAPLEKLLEFVEDIFEAEDSLPPDAGPSEWENSEFLSKLTTDPGAPLLNVHVITKLTKALSQIARPGKRIRLSTTRDGGPGTPRQAGLAEVDTSILSRILKLLSRSVKIGEDIDPFAGAPSSNAVTSEEPSKGKKSMKGSKAKGSPTKAKGSADGGDESGAEENENLGSGGKDQGGSDEVTEENIAALDHVLEMAKESVLAADCCIALLSADKLPKQLYSEELITSCLNTIKNQLTKVIYPFVEANNDIYGHSSALLVYVTKSNTSDSQARRRLVGEIFQGLSAVLPRIDGLVSRLEVSMSDAITIQAVYIAIGPFFVVESGSAAGNKDKASLVLSALGGNSAFRGLRLSALSLIRSIFASHEDQRSWIIEEILLSLIKLPDLKQKGGQFRLRDGRSIHTVSALLLQLVQTSAHDVRIEAKRFARRRRELVAQSSLANLNDAKEELLTVLDREEIRFYTSALESASKAAKTIILFLTQRSGKGKTTKSTNEAEYRAIFDHLLTDLLTVLYWPEWPAASLLLNIVCKLLISSLDDVKSVTNTDTNALRSIALDHLGVIGAKLKSSILRYKKTGDTESSGVGLKPLDEIVNRADIDALDHLLSSHSDISTHLSKRSSDEQAYDSARELTAATCAQEFALALNQCDNVIAQREEVSDYNSPLYTNTWSLAKRLKTAMRDVWNEGSNDVFDVGSEADVRRVDALSEEIGSSRGLSLAFEPILNVVLSALDATAVFMRTKALRALGQIVTSDPTVLNKVNVEKAIESHLLDSSPAVRDAAVELVGKYIIQSPEMVADYYQKIAERIADTGLSVRKRVIKLLKSVYVASADRDRKVDICTKLVTRMLDEDDNVKDLAVTTIGELWFSDLGDSTSNRGRSDRSLAQANEAMTGRISIIMGVTANFRDRQSPLEDLLHQIASPKDEKENSSALGHYSQICDALIDSLVDAQEFPGFTIVNCIKTIYLFASAHPSVISSTKAATLLPYLKNATTAEEQTISDYVLKIFRICIPHMPKTASKFANELQLALQPMITKPSGSGALAALQETVSCLCAVVNNLTRDFVRLVALLKSCNGRLHDIIKRSLEQPNPPATLRAISILMVIVSLLGEHCDFDKLRDENKAIAKDIDAISTGPINEYIYNVLLSLYRKFEEVSVRGHVLQCLGFLFRAHPTLMTEDNSAAMMDAIFESPDVEAKARLLKIMQDFLSSESLKHVSREKASQKGGAHKQVDMQELVGNTDGFADSGVSSAIVQRYLPQILDSALSSHLATQAAAVDIIGFTIRQGLAHPLQCLPVIVALETSNNSTLSSRAIALHTILHTKHTSLLNTRYSECARTSFEYQTNSCKTGVVQGYRMQPTPTALLHRWYSLVREKRSSRQDFLKAIVKVFDLDTTNLACSQVDINFARYMAENVAAFEYKTQEEVLTVIRYLTHVLSVAGMQMINLLSPFIKPIDAPAEVTSEPQMLPDMSLESPERDPIAFAGASVVVGILLILRTYLKDLYGLSEDKCLKWVPGKKSAIGDKVATRRRETPISWERLPFAVQPLATNDDVQMQKQALLTLWEEDGVTAEPVDEE